MHTSEALHSSVFLGVIDTSVALHSSVFLGVILVEGKLGVCVHLFLVFFFFYVVMPKH
jgi:hypothetical protein